MASVQGPAAEPPVVLHVITGLRTGGAEMMLWKLLSASAELRMAAHVVSLTDAGTVGARIQALGVPVTCVGMRRGFSSLSSWSRLRTLARTVRPTILQGWLYHGNLAAALLRGSRGLLRPHLLWNVRGSFVGFGVERPLTRLVIYANAKLSNRPSIIVYNSETSARQHEALGFNPAGRLIISNGFDTLQFRPDPGERERLRARLGLPRDARLIGLIARNHPMKNHQGFLEAAAPVIASDAALHVVLAGAGVPGDAALARSIERLQLKGRVHPMDEVSNVHELLPGLDVVCSASSWGEGFPNVVGEAMACGVPCIVTDVGDSARVVGDTGLVVPVSDTEALSRAIADLISQPADQLRSLGIRARKRIEDQFSLAAIAAEYAALYRNPSVSQAVA